jgi:hypothetical protein
MKLAERIRFLRHAILKSKIHKPSGARRNPKEILDILLSRTAVQDAYLQDRNLLSDFREWQNTNIEQEREDGKK